MVRQLHLGGVIAFSDNVASTGQIRSVNATLERAVRRPWPLFLSVDQEGGIVERVKGDATRFPTFMSAGAAGDPRVTTAAYRASAAELRGLGFDVVFAPDADVTSGPDDPTIGSRSAGSDAAAVGEPGRRRGRRDRAGGGPAGAQALPRARVGAAGQPPHAAGADPQTASSSRPSTSPPSPPRSRRASPP